LLAASVVTSARAGAQPASPPPTLPGAGLLGVGAPQISIPPPAPLTPEQVRTVQRLDAAREQDSGRGLDWIWADVSGGFEQLGLQALSGGDLTFVGGLVNTSSSGGAVSAGVGARLIFLTLLVRGRIGVFGSGQLYRIGPEVGFHVPLGRVEPHGGIGLGYAAMGKLHDNVGGAAAAIALRGFYTRVDAGLDYYPVPAFSVGLDLSADLLGMVRPALTAPQVQLIQNAAGLDAAQRTGAGLLTSTGTGWGGTVAVSAQLGIHL
jgi:hypothetical protein